MADIYATTDRAGAHQRRADVWVAVSALIASMLALPFAQSAWHGPEVAAVLAVAATALLAGQRWALAVVVIAELLLVPTVWPRAFLGAASAASFAALATLFAIVPGVLAMKRAAESLVFIATGRHHTLAIRRRVHAGLAVSGLIAVLLPLL